MGSIHHQSFEVEHGVLTLYFKGEGSFVLLDGNATVFGAAVVRNVRYRLRKCGVPLEAASSKVRVDVEGDFEAEEGILQSSVHDIHAVLDTARTDAALRMSNPETAHEHAVPRDEEVLLGPRVMIVGDQNTGKTSLCRHLVNLAVQSKEAGIAYVDVDVGQQGITCPGSIASAFLQAPVPVDEGFNAVMPLSFFFGDKIVNIATRRRYLDLCACAAQAAAAVGFARRAFGVGGIVINTMGWSTELGRDLLVELLSIFSVTHIIVTGSDSELETAMRNAVLGRRVQVLRYPKQPSVMKRGASMLADARTHQLVTYFAGSPRTPLSPARGVAKVQDVFFLNALTLEPMSWQDVRPRSVAAVSWADSLETAAEANVAGYIILLEVGKRFFSFLAPAAGDLPKPFLLVSSTLVMPAAKIPPLNAH